MFKKIEELVKKIPDQIQKGAKIPVIKATMLGPRSVGKTTIMSSIFSQSCEAIAGTQLFFRPSGPLGAELDKKRLELMNVISKQKTFSDMPNPSVIKATSEETTFDFEMGMTGRPCNLKIQIKDFPGEYIENNKEKVSNFIAESQIIMLAIDTPFLMEENGKYNLEKNKISHINDFFKNHSQSLKDKMLLLIPLKCERYFHDKRMNEVEERVKKEYGELVDFCRKNNIFCAITPIQTIGGVEIDRLADNKDPLTQLFCSKVGVYRYYGNPPKYTPVFCVQPLYYLLVYMVAFYEWQKTSPEKAWYEKFLGSLYSMLNKDKTLMLEIKKLRGKVMTDNKLTSYKILTPNTVLNL